MQVQTNYPETHLCGAYIVILTYTVQLCMADSNIDMLFPLLLLICLQITLWLLFISCLYCSSSLAVKSLFGFIGCFRSLPIIVDRLSLHLHDSYIRSQHQCLCKNPQARYNKERSEYEACSKNQTFIPCRECIRSKCYGVICPLK